MCIRDSAHDAVNHVEGIERFLRAAHTVSFFGGSWRADAGVCIAHIGCLLYTSCAAVKVVIIYPLSAANNTDTVLNTERQMQEWQMCIRDRL